MREVSRRDLLKATAAAVALPGMVAAGAPGLARSDPGPNWPTTELTGTVVRPTDAGYADASLGWNQNFVHHPAAVVFAQNAVDVVNALTWAQQNDVAFRVRSGRHQLQGWNAVDGGLVIDVSQLKATDIDPAALTARVGARITQVEGVTALAQYGLVAPTGEEASVGLIGATLGGGLGLFTRALGMACDHVTAAEIVVASPGGGARIIEVDIDHDPDLLWALRGAGNGNFGIVTALTYRVARAPRAAFVTATWDAPYPLHEIFRAYQGALLADNGVGIELGLHSDRAGLIAALPNGSVAQVQGALAPLLSIGKPAVTTQDDTWGAVFTGFQGRPEDEPGNAEVFSLFADKPFPDRAIDVVHEFILGGSPPPTSESNFQMGGFGSEVKRSAPPGGTAFAYRDALFFGQCAAGWGPARGSEPFTFERAQANSDPQLRDAALAWTTEFYQAVRGSVDQRLGAYVNVPVPALPDWETVYWGAGVDRLRQIKAKYDPDNIFRYEQSIPPATT